MSSSGFSARAQAAGDKNANADTAAELPGLASGGSGSAVGQAGEAQGGNQSGGKKAD